MNNPDIFFDNDQQGMASTYRNAFLKLAYHYVDSHQNAEAIATLNTMMNKISRRTIQLSYENYAAIGNLYLEAGDKNKFEEIAAETEPEARKALDANPNDITAIRVLMNIYQSRKDNVKLLDIWKRIERLYPNDPNVRMNVRKYQLLADSLKN